MPVLLESYSETNTDANGSMDSGSSQGNSIGTTFLCPSSVNIYSVKFYLQKVGSPTGTVIARLASLTGSLTTGLPNSLLASSDTIDVSTLPTSPTLIEFIFSTTFAMVSGTNYAIVAEYSGGDTSNYVWVGVDVSAPTYAGATVDHGGGTWNNSGTAVDTPFYLYGQSSTTQSSSRMMTGMG